MEKNENLVNFDDFKLENILNPSEEPKLETEEEYDPSSEMVEETEEKVEEEPVKKEIEEPKKEVVEDTEEEEESDDVDFKPFVQALHEKFGWEFDDETLEENSLDGVINHLGTIVQSNVEALIDEELSIGDGTLKKMHEYIKDGGDPKRFIEVYYNPIDYSNISLDGDDDLQIRVVKDLLEKQGYDAEEIEDKIETYKNADILEKEAGIAKKKMALYQEKEKESLLEKQAEESKNKIKQVESYWNDVKTKINSWEKIGDFPIIEKDKSAFFDYLTKKDKEGLSQYQREINADKDAAIKMAYIQFKKFNTESIKKAVESDITKKVKANISKFSSSNKSGKSSNDKIEGANKYNDFKLPWS